MNARVVLLGAFIVACGSASNVRPARVEPNLAVDARIDDKLAVHRVAPDTYVITHERFYDSNTLVVVMPDRTVLFASSPFDATATRALVNWVVASFRPSRMLAINTHFHLDGTAGNATYRELGVQTYGSTHTAELLAAQGVEIRDQVAAQRQDPSEQARIRAVQILPPERTFDEQHGLDFDLGGERVEVRYPGPAHSPDNVVVWFPSRGVLFGGCMVRSAESTLGNLGSADIHAWPRAIDSLRALHARVVVPGHGEVGDEALLEHTAALLTSALQAQEQSH